MASPSSVDDASQLPQRQLRWSEPAVGQFGRDVFEDLVVGQAARPEFGVPSPDELLGRLGEVGEHVGDHPGRLTGTERGRTAEVDEKIVVRAAGHVPRSCPTCALKAKFSARYRAENRSYVLGCGRLGGGPR